MSVESYALEIYEKLLVDLSWSSSMLEGNTYSLLETENLLKYQQQAPNKNQIETQMILNHKEAVNFIIRNKESIQLNGISIRNTHALLSDGLLREPSYAGKLRDIPVGIEDTKYLPINFPQILQDEFNLFLNKLENIKDPFEQSFFIMVFIPYLQPFVDINKRTARISCNIPFIKNNISPLSFNEINREEYITALIDIYENNDPTHYSQLFVKAYESSCLRYQIIKNFIVPPNPLKLKYRSFIKDSLMNLIKNKSTQVQTIDFSEIPLSDREALEKLIQEEIKNLHEGNYARFDVSEREYKLWDKFIKK